jgi:hypothetical protein
MLHTEISDVQSFTKDTKQIALAAHGYIECTQMQLEKVKKNTSDQGYNCSIKTGYW